MNSYFLSIGAILGAEIGRDQGMARLALKGAVTEKTPEDYLGHAGWLAEKGLDLADEENQ